MHACAWIVKVRLMGGVGPIMGPKVPFQAVRVVDTRDDEGAAASCSGDPRSGFGGLMAPAVHVAWRRASALLSCLLLCNVMCAAANVHTSNIVPTSWGGPTYPGLPTLQSCIVRYFVEKLFCMSPQVGLQI